VSWVKRKGGANRERERERGETNERESGDGPSWGFRQEKGEPLVSDFHETHDVALVDGSVKSARRQRRY